MKRSKQVLVRFAPMVVAVVGVYIMHLAGVNDGPGVPNAFKALLYMEWFGWIGAVLTFGGLGVAIYQNFFRK